MRYLLLFSLAVMSRTAQPFSFGVKGGIPLTDFLNANGFYQTNTNRYIVGPTVELRLPFGFGVELDALYRHLNYASSETQCCVSVGIGKGDVIFNGETRGNAWEFPVVAKYRFPSFPSRVVRPYVDAGIAWDTLQGLTQTVTQTVIPTSITATTTTSNPQELHKKTTEGFVIGGGIDVHVLVIHISPEIRYTRWGTQHFLSSIGGLSSNQNQAEFLVGIAF